MSSRRYWRHRLSNCSPTKISCLPEGNRLHFNSLRLLCLTRNNSSLWNWPSFFNADFLKGIYDELLLIRQKSLFLMIPQLCSNGYVFPRTPIFDSLKPLLHVETFSWNLCATALRNMFQQALHRVTWSVSWNLLNFRCETSFTKSRTASYFCNGRNDRSGDKNESFTV